jgi:hypothetical protein
MPPLRFLVIPYSACSARRPIALVYRNGHHYGLTLSGPLLVVVVKRGRALVTAYRDVARARGLRVDGIIVYKLRALSNLEEISNTSIFL